MSNWTDIRSPEESLRFLQEVSSLLSDLGGPLTRDLSQLVASGRYVDLINFKFDYGRCDDLRDLVCARQVHALFAKQEWMDLGMNPRKVAEEKFWKMEEKCAETNAALDACRVTPDVWKVIHLSRRIIKRILGPVPNPKDLTFSFGPGATTNVKGRIASPRAKISARLACSREILPVVGRFLAEVPLWAWSSQGGRDSLERFLERTGSVDSDDESELIFYPEIEVHAGKLTYVPKDARSLRPIVVEPTLNGIFQKGVGGYLKDRMLRCVGINLRDQTRNQRLACEGSVHGGYATVDLSSASDTVSISVVRLLLPEIWFDFLSELTTGEINTPNGPRELHKFSSMGNGFTFELESLLFYSIAKAVSELLDLEGEVSIIGDDIIINSRGYTLLTEALNQLGFIVNNEKSFWQGPFRESCGADWFNGNSIRPFYAKKALSEQNLYIFHNYMLRNGERELANLALSWTNPAMRLWGPDGYGDGHLVGSYDLRKTRKLRRSGWEGGFFDTYSMRPNRINKRYGADWVYPSYSVYTRSGERDPTDPDIVRGSCGYAKVSIYTLATTIFGC